MKNKMLYKISVVFSVFLFVFFSFTVYGEPITENISSAIYKIIDYEKSSDLYKNSCIFNAEYLKDADNQTSLAFLTALSRFGYKDDYYAYGAVLKDGVIRSYRTTDKLSSDKVTPWHTISIGLMACGINPQDIKTENGTIDLIKDGVWARSKQTPLEKDGPESLMRGLVLLDAYTTMIPEDASPSYDRNSLIEKIMTYQNEDGSFKTTSVMSDREITAMAVIALAPYQNLDTVFSYTRISDKKEKEDTVGSILYRALQYLSVDQTEDGSFENSGKDNVSVTSKVITALCSLGIDLKSDKRFIKNGNTLSDGLLSLQNEDGSFSDGSDKAATKRNNAYALEALTAYHRFLNNKTPFYDFTDCALNTRDKTICKPNLKNAVQFYIFNDNLVSTDDYENLVVLIDRAENSFLTQEDTIYLNMLKEKADFIYETKIKIKQLDEQGEVLSSPQTVMGSKNTHAVKLFIEQYKTLNEYDKQNVKTYESVIEKKNSMRSKTTVVYLFILVLCIIVLMLVVFLAVFFLRSSPVWDYIYMRFFGGQMIEDDYYDEDDCEDEDAELFNEETAEKPLPYVDNDEFFDYDYLKNPEDDNDDFKIY